MIPIRLVRVRKPTLERRRKNCSDAPYSQEDYKAYDEMQLPKDWSKLPDLESNGSLSKPNGSNEQYV